MTSFNSEGELHKAVKEYLDVALPPGVFFTTIGHGGYPLHPRTASRMKAAGVKAGVPDLMFVCAGVARFIELKTEKGVLSKAQKACHEDIIRAAGTVAVCRSIGQVEDQLRMWGVPLRAKSPRLYG